MQHKTYLLTCAFKDDSDQPMHPLSLISLCCLHEETLQPWLFKMCREDSDQTAWMHRLIWVFTVHKSKDMFSHVVAHLFVKRENMTISWNSWLNRDLNIQLHPFSDRKGPVCLPLIQNFKVLTPGNHQVVKWKLMVFFSYFSQRWQFAWSI